MGNVFYQVGWSAVVADYIIYMQGKLDFKLIGVMYSELLSQSGV